VLCEQAVALGRDVAQLLEARQQVERPRVEDRELLLDADCIVGRLGKRLGRSV